MVRTRTIRAPCLHARRTPRRASTHLGARTEHSIPSSPSPSTATWACSRMAASIFFDRQGTRRRVPLPALALGWTMDMVSGQPLVVDHWPRTELHDLEGGTTHDISRRLELTRADTEPSGPSGPGKLLAEPRNHPPPPTRPRKQPTRSKRPLRSSRVTITYPRYSHSHILYKHLNVHYTRTDRTTT